MGDESKRKEALLTEARMLGLDSLNANSRNCDRKDSGSNLDLQIPSPRIETKMRREIVSNKYLDPDDHFFGEFHIARSPTPVILAPSKPEEEKKIKEIGIIIEKTPLEILEDSRDKICCFRTAYFFTRLRLCFSSFCLGLIQHPLFEVVSLAVILSNCILLALDDPTQDSQEEYQVQADYVFQALYSLEVVLKICALGFCFNKGAYIRDPWNILDFVIVLFGYFSYFEIGSGIDLKALRSFRVLRPLRTISSVEGLRVLMSALMSSLPLLLDTLVILVFFFVVFAIAGVQLWHGVLLSRCVCLETGEVLEDVCGYDECQEGYQCVEYISNPNYGATSFDDVFTALLTVFQCVTLEGWTDTQLFVIHAFGPYAVIFFVPLVLIGAFFLVNFTLAVIKSRVTKVYEENRKIRQQTKIQNSSQQDQNDIEQKIAFSQFFEKIPNQDFDIKEIEKQNHKINEKNKEQKVHNRNELHAYYHEHFGFAKMCKGVEDAGLLHGKWIQNGQFQPALASIKLGPFEQRKNSRQNFAIKFSGLMGIKQPSLGPKPSPDLNEFTATFFGDNNEDYVFKKTSDKAYRAHMPMFESRLQRQNNPSMRSLTMAFVKSSSQQIAMPDSSFEIKNDIFEVDPTPQEEALEAQKAPEEQEVKESQEAIINLNKFVLFLNILELPLTSAEDVIQVKHKELVLASDSSINKKIKYIPTEYPVEDEEESPTPKGKKLYLETSLVKPIQNTTLNQDLTTNVLFPQNETVNKSDPVPPAESIPKSNIPSQKDLQHPVLASSYSIPWSGQEVILNSDPNKAVNVIYFLNSIKIYTQGLSGFIQAFNYYIKKIAKSSILENVMTFFVIINTVTLAMTRYNQPSSEEQILNIMNYFFTGLFLLEMIVKLYGLSLVGYLSDPMNYLDGLVVLFSLVEIVFLDGQGALSAFRTLRIFRAVRMIRALRVLRMARLLRSLRSMQMIIEVIGKTIGSFAYIGLLLLIFIFIYALFGMQIFGGKFKTADSTPRQNFDSFNNAFLTVFQILTMENWQGVLYFGMAGQNSILSALFFVSWIFIGNYILLNLFLAIMLDAFSEIDDEMEKELGNELEDEQESKVSRSRKEFDTISMGKSVVSNTSHISKGSASPTRNRNPRLAVHRVLEEENPLRNSESNYSLFLFSQQNKLRLFIATLVNSNIFEGVILFLICSGSIKLAVDTYYLENYNSTQETFSTIFDIVLSVLFGVEALLKIIAFGFCLEPGSYLRDSWNQLDFFIVCVSFLDLSFSNIDVPMIKVLRLFRTFRPLRFVTHNINMRIIVKALFSSLGAILNTAVVVVVIWLMFSIVGVSFFAGKFQYCSVDQYEISDAAECESQGGEWRTWDHNFDNALNGVITLFILTTQENWPNIVYQAVDCTDVETGPEKGGQPYYAYYFVFFLLIGSMFLLNLFVGVMFVNFTKVQKKESTLLGDIMISEEQLNWIEVQKMIIRSEPNYVARTAPKETAWRKSLHQLVTSWSFEIFISAIILLNMVQLAMLYHDASDSYILGLEIINYIFTGIFTIEIVLKLLAFSCNFWVDTWNIFDFIIVLSSLIDITVSNLSTSSLRILRVGPQLLRVLRVLRVSRLLRLVKKYKRLQDMMEIVQLCLPSMLNVFSLLSLVFFIYAVLGCYLFGDVSSNDSANSYYNFSNFGVALILCFKLATGDDWNMFMFDCARTTTSCAMGIGCGDPIAFIYFISFKFSVSFIMLNLFILIVLQLFEKYYIETDNIVSKFKEDFEVFQINWQGFSTSHSGFMISQEKLLRFFARLPEPLGMAGQDLSKITKQIIDMEIISNEKNEVYFNELLFCTMKRVYRSMLRVNEYIQRKEKEVRKIIQKHAAIAAKLPLYNKTRQEIITTVNPFISMMILRMTIKAWKRYSSLEKEKALAVIKAHTQRTRGIAVRPFRSGSLDIQKVYPVGQLQKNSEKKTTFSKFKN